MDLHERRFTAIDALLDYSKGTLWWVHNRLWNENIRGFVWKKNSVFHPGLSICQEKSEGLYTTIPMILGTSRKLNGSSVLTVVHMSPEGAAHHDKPGYFSVLRPCPLRINDFGRKNTITQNAVKPHLDRSEMRKLDEILAGKEP